jgi:tRNA(Ile)-lysidine synthase
MAPAARGGSGPPGVCHNTRMGHSDVPAADAFLTALEAGLPDHGFWESPVVVGVSGGADSVALLLGLYSLTPAGRPPQLIVAHVQYDLRAEAADDQRFVAALAGRLGLRCESRTCAVRAGADGEGDGIEARARRLRYDFFETLAHANGARYVAVAHTADDQAETVLHRALRGTGLAGLSGMAPARALCEGVSLIRPLLHVPRGVVREYLAAVGEPWREDASNADTRLTRNFLRHELLAKAAAGPYPAVAAALERLGRHASKTAGALASAARHVLEAHSSRHADGRLVVRTAALAPLDPHLVAEVFVAAWHREGWPQRDMTARHYASLAEMVAGGESPRAIDLPAGIRARRVADTMLEISPPA